MPATDIVPTGLGEVVSWEPPKEVDIATFTDIMTTNGLEQYLTTMKPTTAFGRATRELSKGRVIRPLKAVNGTRRFQLTTETKQEHAFEYEREAGVNFDTATMTIECPEKSSLVPILQTEFRKKLGLYVNSDITHALQKALSDGTDMFQLTARSKFYWLPPGNAGRIDQVRRVVEAISGKWFHLEIPKSTTGARMVKDAIADGIAETIDSLTDAIDNFDVTTRDNTMKIAAERIQILQMKSEGYSELLAEYKEALDTKLVEARQKLRVKVSSLMATEAADATMAASTALAA